MPGFFCFVQINAESLAKVRQSQIDAGNYNAIEQKNAGAFNRSFTVGYWQYEDLDLLRKFLPKFVRGSII